MRCWGASGLRWVKQVICLLPRIGVNFNELHSVVLLLLVFQEVWGFIFGGGKSLSTSWTQLTFDIYIFIAFALDKLEVAGIFPTIKSLRFHLQHRFPWLHGNIAAAAADCLVTKQRMSQLIQNDLD